MWTGGATGVARCPDLVAYLDVLPHTDPCFGEVAHLNLLATVRFQLDIRSISTRIIGSGNRNRARCGRVERGADVDSEVDSVMSRVVTLRK